MAEIKITVDGKEIVCDSNKSILDIASGNGINIPNLCYLKDMSPYGACGMCVVEAEGSNKLLRACSAKPYDGMVIHTQSKKVIKSRRLALELLMSDHDGDCIAPCSLNCPARTDCQKYIAQIAEKDYDGAVKTIFEKIPLPASIGRVCPHPCEKSCRRQNVDESLSIAYLKAFAADKLISTAYPVENKKPSSGKTVGIIGGGPAGLSAAYRLSLNGHKVTVYDKMPGNGGMLRYGIPEYRLPKNILEKEIENIKNYGVEFINNCEIGKDIYLSEIRQRYDAVLVCTGAWKSSSIHCKGENLVGVYGGIDFLREIALGNKPEIGEKCAVVGGGNTAMDACRSAVRLGAKEVSIIYRRTRAEMPAEAEEIDEAEAEGVVFRFLTNPDEIIGKDGKVSGVKLQVMELGEPDEKGRRKPVPVDGKFVNLELDSIIIAAGQKNDLNGFEELELTERGTFFADEHTFLTSLDGVFAAGDAVNKGASIAINAIAQANQAAKYIDAYLSGIEIPYKKSVLSEREIRPELFEGKEKLSRAVMPQRTVRERRNDFNEINLGFSEEQAINEAKRCLECGCHNYGECRLIKYANEYCVDCKHYNGEKHNCKKETKLVSIERDQNKCILCGLCVRICEEKAGKGILGLIGRGFNTVIKPEFENEGIISGCKDCLECVKNCPTGALKILK